MAENAKKAQADVEEESYNDEPANISLEFQNITQMIFKQILKELTLNEFSDIM